MNGLTLDALIAALEAQRATLGGATQVTVVGCGGDGDDEAPILSVHAEADIYGKLGVCLDLTG